MTRKLTRKVNISFLVSFLVIAFYISKISRIFLGYPTILKNI